MTMTARRAALALAMLALLATIAAIVVARSTATQPLGPQRTVVGGETLVVPDPIDATSWRLRIDLRGALLCLSAHHLGGRQNAGACSRAGTTWAAARDIEGRVPRTFVMGYAAAGVRRVTVSGPGGARIFELTRRGRTFLAVFSGRVSVGDLAVVATTGNGHKTVGLGPGTEIALTPDPHHGPAWYANAMRFTGGPRRGQTCVHIGREQPRFGPMMSVRSSRPICSDMTGTSYFFKVVRLQGQTVLTGVGKRSVTVFARPLSAPAGTGTRQAAIERRNGAFVLVFDGSKVHSDGLAITVKVGRFTKVVAAQRAMNLGFTSHVPPDLIRNAQSDRGPWLYHGLRISSDAAARHHLKCSSDLRICDDSQDKLLAYMLHQSISGGGYEAPDGSACPLIPFESLPPGAEQAAAAEVLREAPALYGDKTKGAKVVSVAAATEAGPRGGYARVKCGKTAQQNSLVVELQFPAMLPSASMSQGTVLVGSFWGQLRVWARLH